MVYEVKRNHYAEVQSNYLDNDVRYANGEETYQEDRAFVNRLKRKHPRDYNVSEIQRLNRIAERGMARGYYG